MLSDKLAYTNVRLLSIAARSTGASRLLCNPPFLYVYFTHMLYIGQNNGVLKPFHHWEIPARLTSQWNAVQAAFFTLYRTRRAALSERICGQMGLNTTICRRDAGRSFHGSLRPDVWATLPNPKLFR